MRCIVRSAKPILWSAALWMGAWPSSAMLLHAVEPRSPGLNDLVVIDPGVHDRGLPAVIITDDQKVDIPPALHVHRYYYSENKEFQGPLTQGGPTIVVADHPKTSERLYIDVTLPPGAPEIAYDKDSITYIYPEKRIQIYFGHFFSDKVTVKHLPGQGLSRKIRDDKEKFREKLQTARQRSKLAETFRTTLSGGKDVAVGAAGVVGTVSNVALEKTTQFIGILPGVQALKSLGEQAEERLATEEIRQAGLRQRDEAQEFIKTVR